MGGLKLIDLLTNSYCIYVCTTISKLIIKSFYVDFVWLIHMNF